MSTGRNSVGGSEPENERGYRTLIETAQEGIGLLDLESGAIKYCNETYAKILECSPLELVGRSFFEYLDKSQRLRASQERELRLQGIGSAYEIDIVIADGVNKHLSATGSPIVGTDGKCEGVVHTILDITDRKRAEEALRESEDMFRHTFEAAAVGMAHLAPDGRLLRANDKLCEILGYKRAELLTLSLHDILHPDNLESNNERIQGVLDATTSYFQVDERLYHKDSRIIWIQISCSAIRKDSGELLCLISVIEDITSRKLKEIIPEGITEREKMVLNLVARWKTNLAIAEELKFSKGTVKLILQRLISKLKVNNRRQAVERAVEIGLIPPPR